MITTNLEVARRKPREPAHWEHVADDALAEVQRMGVIVDKLLELSRAGAAGLQHAPTELRKLATAAIAARCRSPSEHGVQLELVAGSPVTAEIDADAIGIVLDNLLRNAIDHSPKDATVTITIALDNEKPQIVVDDRGPGVPADLRERIFEPFARAATRHRSHDRSRTRPRSRDLPAHRQRSPRLDHLHRSPRRWCALRRRAPADL